MHTKKIAIIIFDLKGNGAEKVMLTLADWFLIKNHDCQIICLKNLIQLSSQYNPKIHIFPIKYFRWIPKKIRSPIVAFFLDKFILRKFLGNPDLILSNLLPVDTILAYSNLKNIHYIIHNTPKYDWQLADQNKNNTLKRMQKIYLKHPCICVSEGVQENLKLVLPDIKNPIRIYNPIDTDYIKEQSLHKLCLILPDNFLLHIGKFTYRKRHDLLIEAYVKSGVSIPLVLLGQGSLIKEIDKKIKELNQEKKIIILGFYSNPYPIIKKSTALLLSSDYEGLPTVILEALALNIPVISTNCPSGPSEILPEHNLVPTRNVDAMAEKINKLVQNPEFFRTPFNIKFTSNYAGNQYLKLIH